MNRAAPERGERAVIDDRLTVEVGYYLYLWYWFCELWRGESLSYAEILAWSQLTGNKPTTEDVRLIKKLDAIMRSD